MAKTKVTVTLDEDLVEMLRADDESISGVVNASVRSHLARRRRQAALQALLADWDEQFGEVSEAAADGAAAAFDEADAGTVIDAATFVP